MQPNVEAKRLRDLLNKPGLVRAPGAFDAWSARFVEKAGFPAADMTGYGASASVIGRPDIGLMTMSEILHDTDGRRPEFQRPHPRDLPDRSDAEACRRSPADPAGRSGNPFLRGHGLEGFRHDLASLAAQRPHVHLVGHAHVHPLSFSADRFYAAGASVRDPDQVGMDPATGREPNRPADLNKRNHHPYYKRRSFR